VQTYRESRVLELMEQTGWGRLQAINAIRQQNARHDALRRDPRAFDFRFGRQLQY
jgi:hypothetical protein